jgi:hypothetical protein
MKHRILIATGISISILSIVLIIYFQFFKNETIKAEEKQNLTSGSYPVDINIANPLIATEDTLSRNGNRYIIAQPLELTPVYTAE